MAWLLCLLMCFPDSSVSKETNCNAGDPSSITRSGRSAGEGIGYPLQYSWASFVAQLVKNPVAMQETWVLSLGWEDSLDKGKANHSRILSWRIPWTVESMESQSQTRLRDFHFANVVYHIDWFVYIGQSLHLWSESHFIVVYSPSYVLLGSDC